MDTKELRQKILDLAIRGKLVPQDPNDEPASVLLERIRAEKERLIAEGKIKRPKKSKASSAPSHYQNFTPPFEIPDSWEWVTIADICSKIGSGSTPKGSNYSLDGIPFFRSQNIYNEGLVYTDIKYISEITHKSMISTEVIAGDLLLNITGGSLGRCTVIPDNFSRGNVSQHVCILRPIFVLPHFFHCLILSSYFKKAMNLTGSGREGLPKYNLEVMNFPLPPIEEQKRIVATVRTFLEILNLLDSSKASLCDEICKAKSKILDLAMQGKLVPQNPTDEPAADMLLRINPKAKIITDNPHYPQLPSGWCIAAIRDTFEINPKIIADGDTEAGFVPMASICDGFNNSFIYTPRKWDEIKNGFTHFANGDIAVAKISPCLENRKSMILKNLPNGIGSGTTELLVFRSKVIYPEYGLLFFKSDNFIKQCVGTFNGVVGQQRVGKNIVEEIPFPIPPYKAQIQIANEANRLFAILDEISSNLTN